MVLRYATRRGNQRGLGNLRFAAIDAQHFLAFYLATSSVREVHCYHPQPYHNPHPHPRPLSPGERGEWCKRLLAPLFLADVNRVLEAGGTLHVQTDNLPYWVYLKGILPTLFDFHEQSVPWPDTPTGRTRREIIALKRGYPIYRGWGVVKKEMSSAEAIALAQNLPLPTFDAGPRRKDLDQLERE